MLWKKKSSSDDEGSEPVHLNVYDLAPFNGCASWLGLGVYHSGVEVHGVEYSFGAHEHLTSGIFEGKPKQCEGLRVKKTILIGKTGLGPAEVRALMKDLAKKYRGNAYNLISNNCNHFCKDVCIRLTGNKIPRWVNRVARIGFLCNCFLPATLNPTNVQHHKTVKDEADEGEKKERTSDSSKFTSSSNSFSSPNTSSSASTSSESFSTQVSRRSRTRNRSQHRALLPASPLDSGS